MRLILEIPDPLGAALLVQAVKERTSVEKMLIPFLELCVNSKPFNQQEFDTWAVSLIDWIDEPLELAANSKPMPTWCSCDDGRTCENHMRAHRGINPEE